MRGHRDRKLLAREEQPAALGFGQAEKPFELIEPAQAAAHLPAPVAPAGRVVGLAEHGADLVAPYGAGLIAPCGRVSNGRGVRLLLHVGFPCRKGSEGWVRIAARCATTHPVMST